MVGEHEVWILTDTQSSKKKKPIKQKTILLSMNINKEFNIDARSSGIGLTQVHC